MQLVDGDVPRRSVDLGGRRHDQSLEFAASAACVQEVGRAGHVRLHDVQRVLVRIGYRNERSQVHNPFGVVDGGLNEARIFQIASHHFDGVFAGFWQLVKLAPVVSPVVPDHGADLAPVRNQTLDQVAADEAGRAGH